MKTKTARKTIIFLPLLAILAFAVSSIWPVANANAADAEAANFEEFVTKLNDSEVTRVYINGDITFQDDVVVDKVVITRSTSTLDLNGHKMTLNNSLSTSASTTIKGGVIESDFENPIMTTTGDLTIESGSFVGGINSYAFIISLAGFDSNITILGGDFDVSNIIVNNYGSGKVTVSGGHFKSAGKYYEDAWNDSAFMTSDKGSFEINGEDVVVESNYRFLGESFADPEELRGEVICTKGQVYEAKDWTQMSEDSDEWVEFDYNTMNICGENKTLAEDEEVEGTGNIKLINSNITIPAGISLTNPSAKIIVAKDSSFRICGEYVGSDDSLVEEGGTIIRECEKKDDDEKKDSDDNPPTFDNVTFAVVILASSVASVVFGLTRIKARNK